MNANQHFNSFKVGQTYDKSELETLLNHYHYMHFEPDMIAVIVKNKQRRSQEYYNFQEVREGTCKYLGMQEFGI